jgi:hypothetical protein
LKIIKIAALIALFSSTVPMASEPPPAPGEDLACPEPREFGSAGFIHNMAGHPDSIRAVAGRLLDDALNGEATQAHECGPDCVASDQAEVVYRVVPTSFLAAEEQRDVCLQLETETKETPLRFEPKAFDTVDELNEWIMAFSQGQGEDGELLYERCYSNCSPRYTFLIAGRTSGFEVQTEVQCGLARDRSNDQYRITTALRRSCAFNLADRPPP